MNHPLLKPRRALVPAFAVLALCTSFTFPAGPLHAQRGDRQKETGGTSGVITKTDARFLATFKSVLAKAGQSTVRVQCDSKHTALGVVITADGYILTKYSDLAGTITVKTSDGESHEATIVGVAKIHDLAMLKIDASDLTPVVWKDSKGATPGDWVASAGVDGEAVAVGVVSVGTRNVPGAKGATAAPSIPTPNSAFLGIGPADPDGKECRIGALTKDSPAAKAGLLVDDVIIKIGDAAIGSFDDLLKQIQKRKVGDTVALEVRRGDETMPFKVTLGKRPADKGAGRGDFQNSMGSELSKVRTGFPTILQHDQIIKPSDCGGPLVDLDGNVIGLNISRAGRVESYAIPAEVIRPLLAELRSGKLAPKN